MSRHALCESIQPIAALEYRHDSSPTELVGEPDDDARNRRVAFRRDVELPEQVSPHAVEAGAHENEVRLEAPRCGHELLLEGRENLRIAGARRQRHIQLGAGGLPCSGLRRASRPRIRAVVMRAEVEDRVVVVENILRSVSLVVVYIVDKDAYDRSLL